MQVKRGDVVLLTGGNGSGKSTLLKCIYNLLPCWRGDIFFEGDKINDLKSSDLIRKGIVYIPQKDFCFENLTIDENLQIAGNILHKELLKERITEVYKLTRLGKFKNRKPFHLSGGEKKLLAFGMALIHNPKLVLFDEPLSGLSKKNIDNIVNLLFEQKKNNIGFIVIEHTKKIISDKIFKLTI